MNPEIEKPKPSVDTFELPCGYIDAEDNLHTDVTVSEMTGEEEEILAARNMPAGKKINKILTRCTQSIGTIPAPMMPRVIPDLTQGDRVFLLIAIRRASLGNEMPFVTKCPSCEQDSRFVLDLADLETKKMPDPMVRFYDLELPKSGHKVRMRVLTGRGEEAISKAANKGIDIISTAIIARMESMDDKPVTMKDLKKLPLMDRNFLREAWEDHEGGVDTAVEIECTNCSHDYESDLDISQQGFFNPSATLKSWKNKYSF